MQGLVGRVGAESLFNVEIAEKTLNVHPSFEIQQDESHNGTGGRNEQINKLTNET